MLYRFFRTHVYAFNFFLSKEGGDPKNYQKAKWLNKTIQGYSRGIMSLTKFSMQQPTLHFPCESACVLAMDRSEFQ
jgi:hypothetical protein